MVEQRNHIATEPLQPSEEVIEGQHDSGRAFNCSECVQLPGNGFRGPDQRRSTVERIDIGSVTSCEGRTVDVSSDAAFSFLVSISDHQRGIGDRSGAAAGHLTRLVQGRVRQLYRLRGGSGAKMVIGILRDESSSPRR